MPLKSRAAGWPSLDYPVDMTPKVNYRGPYDCAGIPLLDYKGGTGVQYNPCAVAQFGLGHYQKALDGDAKSMEQAALMGDWLLDWSEHRINAGRWLPYKFSIPEFGLQAPFYSGLAQGNAISLLLRLGKAFGDQKYSETANEMLTPMLLPVVDGGLSREVDGVWLIEEFVMTRLSAVLDGWMFAIIALGDLVHFMPKKANRERFNRSIRSLEKMLPCFDLGYWSRADLYAEKPPMPASHFYHQLHILQLTALAEATASPILRFYAKKWRVAWASNICRFRALAAKVMLKILRY